MTDVSQEAALRKLRTTPVVRSKEPMPAEARMEMIELVQTNVDKVSIQVIDIYLKKKSIRSKSSFLIDFGLALFFVFSKSLHFLIFIHIFSLFLSCINSN